VAGLGNPGDRYAGTRHNVGFDVVDALARRSEAGRVRVDRLDCRALTGRLVLHGNPFLLAKPQTYMNCSGESLKGLLVKHGVDRSRTMVVLDDFALPLGRIRIRAGGSAGGHNGLQNVVDCLGTNEVPRLRIGVAGEHLARVDDKADYVLDRFTRAERAVVDQAIEEAADAVALWAESGIDTAMNRFNRAPEESPA
jgi:peptidyl-tRNA hydrolase, PTH1 family